jgi:hypothetical protein
MFYLSFLVPKIGSIHSLENSSILSAEIGLRRQHPWVMSHSSAFQKLQFLEASTVPRAGKDTYSN